MDLRIIVLFITTGANLALAFFVLAKDWLRRINKYFALVLLSIASWSFFLALFYAAGSVGELHSLIPPIYISAAFISLFFYLFCTSFPFDSISMSKARWLVHFFLIAAVIIVIIYLRVEKEIIFDKAWGHPTTVNAGAYALYSLYFLGYIFLSFYHLIKKIRISTGYTKRLIAIVLYSTLLAAFFGSVFDLFFPIVTYQYVWIGPLFTVAMVFIIVRYVFIKEPE
ncbi:MAG: hypothetical protein A3B31_03115 [Candidatus Komeilibacteria bacterium RIFCSPLOWO2_01_FULL_53_11]|uniref:Histidine kinase N-terminal 7TM region domain-containing protein n=1 Tax=Candidatus Komeilibacteria bacterium RIFCSPLOWO2_01_FULL_53_11 TaxID=1798552 RepID=A0A1G2BP35_9BACT|nr:MAG: hypothetical protein A3B31_03115 [Candidatus Komeilibacteria bacterium RIFCSPLOWO2_01_FULL_53_11]